MNSTAKWIVSQFPRIIKLGLGLVTAPAGTMDTIKRTPYGGQFLSYIVTVIGNGWDTFVPKVKNLIGYTLHGSFFSIGSSRRKENPRKSPSVVVFHSGDACATTQEGIATPIDASSTNLSEGFLSPNLNSTSGVFSGNGKNNIPLGILTAGLSVTSNSKQWFVSTIRLNCDLVRTVNTNLSFRLIPFL